MRDWSSRRQSRFRRTSINSMILGSLFVGCLSILFLSLDLTRKASSPEDFSFRHIDLSAEWSYALDTGHRAPGELPSPPTEGWKSFDPKNSRKLSSELKGSYWLKKTFVSPYGFQNPSIVLGQIPGSHRVYLNGQPIGGANTTSELPFYVFDSSLLKLDGPNTLYVSIKSPLSLYPGVSSLSGVGMFLGNFEDVRRSAVSGQITQFAFRSVSLALAASLFFSAFFFAIFRRAHRHFLYSSLYLLLGTLHLAFYHPWISTKLDAAHLHLLESVSLAMAPVVIYSAYLHLGRRYLAEAINSGIGLVFLASLYSLNLSNSKPVQLELAAAYAGGWVAYAIYDWIKNKRVHTRESLSLSFEFLFLSFGVASFGALIAAASQSEQAGSWTEAWAIGSPFVFSAFVLITATIDREIQDQILSQNTSRDRLVMGLLRLIQSSPDVMKTAITIQERVCAFLRAQRSTLYIVHTDNAGLTWLKATYIHGDQQAQQSVSRTVRPDEGIIGYVCMHRSPLLIQDILQDPRFSETISKRSAKGEKHAYRTGTCMIFPLVAGNQLLGVLTFADKTGDVPFSREDFTIALEISNDLAVLFDNRHVQDALQKKLKSQAG